MKKKVYWIILILIIIVAGVDFYIYKNINKKESPASLKEKEQQTLVIKYITKTPIHFEEACLNAGGDWEKTDYNYDGECVFNKKEDCINAGGDWICLGGMACATVKESDYSCIFPYIDGGKECSDGPECLGGWCEASEIDISLYSKEAWEKENSSTKKNLKGTCIKEKGFSPTHYYLEKGKIQLMWAD